ncbi:hypothetical protein R3P38DRAFT_3234043 [Favolaschia claudopus]|uniref:Uncharacterized protein n=1 Tax=Favolaschia claudopus TaxID=2862362 RepID=A0AAV9ZGR8_9AGAR
MPSQHEVDDRIAYRPCPELAWVCRHPIRYVGHRRVDQLVGEGHRGVYGSTDGGIGLDASVNESASLLRYTIAGCRVPMRCTRRDSSCRIEGGGWGVGSSRNGEEEYTGRRVPPVSNVRSWSLNEVAGRLGQGAHAWGGRSRKAGRVGPVRLGLVVDDEEDGSSVWGVDAGKEGRTYPDFYRLPAVPVHLMGAAGDLRCSTAAPARASHNADDPRVLDGAGWCTLGMKAMEEEEEERGRAADAVTICVSIDLG